MTKGITISDIELRMLIEAAVAEFNDAFHSAETEIEVETEETAEAIDIEVEV